MTSLPKRSSLYYKPNQAEVERLAKYPLEEVIVAGTKATPSDANSVYHFRVSFVAANHCIRLDATPGADLANAVLMVEYEEYQSSGNSGLQYTAPATGTKTVHEALQLTIDSKGRDKYEFDKTQGCRHWSFTILEDLAEAGFVKSTEPGDFTKWEDAKLLELGPTVFPMPRIKGTFY